MAALTAARVSVVSRKSIRKTVFPLGVNKTAWEGGLACIDSAALGAIWPGAVSTTLTPLGIFLQTVATAGVTQPVGVELFQEMECQIWDSVVGAGAITIANLFAPVYIASDHELTTVSTGASIYGTVMGIGPQGQPGGVVVYPIRIV